MGFDEGNIRIGRSMSPLAREANVGEVNVIAPRIVNTYWCASVSVINK